MDPTLIVEMVKAGFEFGSKLCDVLLSYEGQAGLKAAREDNAEFKKSMAGAGAWLESLFSGKLFGVQPPAKPIGQ